MAELPAKNILDGTKVPATKVSEMKSALGALRDYLNGLLGASGNVADARAALGAAAADSMGKVLLATLSASASASLDFTNLTGYSSFEFELENVGNSTAAAILLMRISTDNGATYKSGASDYKWMLTEVTSAAATGVGASAGDTAVRVNAAPLSTNVFAGVSGDVKLVGANKSDKYKSIIFHTSTAVNSSGISADTTGSGNYVADGNVINAVRFVMTVGNIDKGIIKCYGIRG